MQVYDRTGAQKKYWTFAYTESGGVEIVISFLRFSFQIAEQWARFNSSALVTIEEIYKRQ